MNENRPTIGQDGWTRRVVLVAAAGAIGAAMLTGCGSSSGSSGSASGTSSSATSGTSSSAVGAMPATSTTIMIDNFSYTTPASVGPGATVRVMNMDSEAHTVTADTGSAFAVTVPPGKTVTFTAPSSPGSFAFHCDYHANMHGTLVVK